MRTKWALAAAEEEDAKPPRLARPSRRGADPVAVVPFASLLVAGAERPEPGDVVLVAGGRRCRCEVHRVVGAAAAVVACDGRIGVDRPSPYDGVVLALRGDEPVGCDAVLDPGEGGGERVDRVRSLTVTAVGDARQHEQAREPPRGVRPAHAP